MRKFGEVLDYRTADKAVVGKKYVFGDCLREICENPERFHTRNLIEIRGADIFPFRSSNNIIRQFCREVIEEEEGDRMTNRQLGEWLAKGNGEWSDSINDWSSAFRMHRKGSEGEAVPENLRIRSWGSDEWVVPTVEIYERDCKGVK